MNIKFLFNIKYMKKLYLFFECSPRKSLVLSVCVLLCLFFAIACENKESEAEELISDVEDVPYKACPCEFSVEPTTIQGEAHFSIQSEARFFTDTFWGPNYMVWYNNRDKDNAILMLRPGDNSIPIKVNICNFPDFAKKWHSENGITVYYEGIMYPSWCEELTLGCRGFCGTMILTKLKIK